MITYEGSALWKHIEYTNDMEALSNMAKYIDAAIIYHEQNEDADNAEFFKEAQRALEDKNKS
jgi:nitrate reductase NapAB chaperone NapD